MNPIQGVVIINGCTVTKVESG